MFFLIPLYIFGLSMAGTLAMYIGMVRVYYHTLLDGGKIKPQMMPLANRSQSLKSNGMQYLLF
jgi:hypothetical protein